MKNEKKLKLNKKVIISLSKNEEALIKGGVVQKFTTSWNSCTGFLCCPVKPLPWTSPVIPVLTMSGC